MPFVVDASVAASWFLPDERPPQTQAAYELLTTDYAVVPTLWWYELRNVFVVNERRGRIDRVQTERALLLLEDASFEFDQDPGEEQLLDVARRRALTVYDAAYLELAQRRNLPLATLDRALGKAAQAEGVALIGA